MDPQVFDYDGNLIEVGDLVRMANKGTWTGNLCRVEHIRQDGTLHLWGANGLVFIQPSQVLWIKAGLKRNG